MISDSRAGFASVTEARVRSLWPDAQGRGLSVPSSRPLPTSRLSLELLTGTWWTAGRTPETCVHHVTHSLEGVRHGVEDPRLPSLPSVRHGARTHFHTYERETRGGGPTGAVWGDSGQADHRINWGARRYAGGARLPVHGLTCSHGRISNSRHVQQSSGTKVLIYNGAFPLG